MSHVNSPSTLLTYPATPVKILPDKKAFWLFEIGKLSP